jgi:hypothetical protein
VYLCGHFLRQTCHHCTPSRAHFNGDTLRMALGFYLRSEQRHHFGSLLNSPRYTFFSMLVWCSRTMAALRATNTHYQEILPIRIKFHSSTYVSSRLFLQITEQFHIELELCRCRLHVTRLILLCGNYCSNQAIVLRPRGSRHGSFHSSLRFR